MVKLKKKKMPHGKWRGRVRRVVDHFFHGIVQSQYQQVTLVRSNGLNEDFSACAKVITWMYIVQDGYKKGKIQLLIR